MCSWSRRGFIYFYTMNRAACTSVNALRREASMVTAAAAGLFPYTPHIFPGMSSPAGTSAGARIAFAHPIVYKQN